MDTDNNTLLHDSRGDSGRASTPRACGGDPTISLAVDKLLSDLLIIQSQHQEKADFYWKKGIEKAEHYGSYYLHNGIVRGLKKSIVAIERFRSNVKIQ
jgi:hypothetical protein